MPPKLFLGGLHILHDYRAECAGFAYQNLHQIGMMRLPMLTHDF
nr:MAG TPA: hypothetical protein [Caudoviricetes sp.]